jgi:hypothetical protein
MVGAMSAARRSRAELDNILDVALGFVRSVPYAVSARWLFYRLLQSGYVVGKEAYKPFLWLTGDARKRFYRGWNPGTLADDTRTLIRRGRGDIDHGVWVAELAEWVQPYVDSWKHQPNYVLVLYEAAAMSAQFDHYLPKFVSRCAFKGDVSIPAKWTIALHITEMWKRYEKPVKIVYFGDNDPKGLEIPLSAKADILRWALMLNPELDVEWVRAGLNPGDEDDYDIPENPDRPGCYQWEALDDEQAGAIIQEAVGQFLNEDAEELAGLEEDLRIASVHGWWKQYGPSVADLDDLGYLAAGGAR